MRKLSGLTIVLGLALVLLPSAMVTASTESEEELQFLFLKYEQAVETGDLETLGELFWHDERLTVFWPCPERLAAPEITFAMRLLSIPT